MDDALLVRGFERVRDLARDRERLVNRQRARRQTLGERRAFHELEHEAADAVRPPPIHRSRRCADGSASPAPAPRVRSARAAPGSERKALATTLMATSRPSLVSRARYTSPIPPAPRRERICVRTDLPAHERRRAPRQPGRAPPRSPIGVRGTAPPSARAPAAPPPPVAAPRRLRMPPRRTRPAREHRGRAPRRRGLRYGCRRSGSVTALSPSSSRSNQSFASRQSRLTVSGDTWSTSAVSSTLKPPKKRNSIDPALPNVNRRQCLQGAIQRQHVHCRFRRRDEPFVQRHSLRRRRRVCDSRATARDRRARGASGGPKSPRKCARSCQRTRRASVNRRNASFTSAVVCNVWPRRSRPHVPASQPAQLRLHERRQLLERAIIAVAPRPQQLGDRPG